MYCIDTHTHTHTHTHRDSVALCMCFLSELDLVSIRRGMQLHTKQGKAEDTLHSIGLQTTHTHTHTQHPILTDLGCKHLQTAFECLFLVNLYLERSCCESLRQMAWCYFDEQMTSYLISVRTAQAS